MEKIYINRLKTLALHLKMGQLKTPVKAVKEEPSLIDNGEFIEQSIPYLSYPLDELPFLFKEWKTDIQGNPFWKGDENKHPVSSTIYFFDISFDIFQHLFIPSAQNIHAFGGYHLRKSALPSDVAENILELVKIIEAK